MNTKQKDVAAMKGFDAAYNLTSGLLGHLVTTKNRQIALSIATMAIVAFLPAPSLTVVRLISYSLAAAAHLAALLPI